MTTVQILTKNNESTIKSTIESVSQFDIIVGDLGSTDNTIAICRQYNIQLMRLNGMPRHQARQKMLMDGPTLMLQPWEVLVEGHQNLESISTPMHVKVMDGKNLTKEVRAWNGKVNFENPVFETVDSPSTGESKILIYCISTRNNHDDIEGIRAWKAASPLDARPYYYEGCIYLSENKHQESLNALEHYLFHEKKLSISATMARYYCSLIYLMHRKQAKPSLQYLNLCLCANPLMAEFWCITGDVYYHLLQKFWLAKEFYENAIIMGSRRLSSDLWPMNIAKYREYPEKMMDSCDKILSHTSIFGH